MATSAVSIIVRTLNFAPRMRPTLLDTPAALLRVPQCQFNFLFRLGFRRIAEPASSTNMSGQDLYELICGTCHDTGVNGGADYREPCGLGAQITALAGSADGTCRGRLS